MSSLYASFTAFKKNHFTIDRIGNIYVEIERMLDESLIEEKENKGKVLYIDSSSYIDLNELLKEKDLSVYQAFIFDTTDYLDDLCLPIINKLLEYKVCLIDSYNFAFKHDEFGTTKESLERGFIIPIEDSAAQGYTAKDPFMSVNIQEAIKNIDNRLDYLYFKIYITSYIHFKIQISL